MSGTWRRWVLVGAIGLVGCRTTGSAGKPPIQEVEFDPVEITADLELEKLNDEELFAGGTAAYAAEDYKQAARYFGRLADFHPDSKHFDQAVYTAGLAHERLEEWEEALLRKALSDYEALPDKDEVAEHLPAQAHFYMGEIYRQYFEGVKLDPSKGVDKLAE